MTKQFTLRKEERLKSRKAIDQLFKAGHRFVVAPFRVLYLVTTATDKPACLQFGVAVSTKKFKKSVDRNRVKRITREAYRLQKKELTETVIHANIQLQLFFIYTSPDLPGYDLVFQKTTTIIKKLIHLVNEINTPHT